LKDQETTMLDLQRQIADLEREIERLSAVAERCRKIIAVSKVAAIGGGLLLGGLVLGLFRFDPVVFVLGLTAALAGIALLGTNTSTLEELIAKVQAHEGRRRELIDAIGLRVVEGGRTATIN
jgi:hypothetical protein